MTPKDKPLTIEEMEKAGILFFPNEIESDIIYVDKDGNEIEAPDEGEQLI